MAHSNSERVSGISGAHFAFIEMYLCPPNIHWIGSS